MLYNDAQQTVTSGSTVPFANRSINPAVGGNITVSGTDGVTLAAGQYLVTFVSDAGVAAADEAITAALQLDSTPITYAETNLERGGAAVERIALSAIVTSTGGQTLTVVNNGADDNTHENTVLTVVQLS